MKRQCEKIRNAVAELGPRGLDGDEVAQEHVVGCEECFALLEAAAELEAELDGLETIDAPDGVVARLLARVEEEATAEERGSAGFLGGRLLRLARLKDLAASWTPRQAAVAALFVVVMTGLVVVALPERGRMPADGLSSTLEPAEGEAGSVAVSIEAEPSTGDSPAETPVSERLARTRPVPPPQRQLSAEKPAAQSGPGAGGAISSSDAEGEGFYRKLQEANGLEPAAPPKAGAGSRGAPADAKSKTDLGLEHATFDGDAMVQRDELMAEGGLVGAEADQLLVGDMYGYAAREEGENRRAPGRTAVADARGQAGELRHENQLLLDTIEAEIAGKRRGGEDEESRLEELVENVEPTARARRAARQFLEERRRTEGLAFQEASGYWANTYVPGDPVLRLLDARLAGRDRSPFEGYAASPVALHDASRQPVQPFDPPQDAALGVYLAADRAALEAEGRMLVQVGLEATPRRSGRRGAMNVALVLDLRGSVDLETASAMRALAFAFAAARDVGDRFHLAVAGRPGGMLVGADDFRHGPLAVALDEVLGARGAAPGSRSDRRTAGPGGGVELGVEGAMEAALDALTTADDATAPLGSSVVVLVTGQALGGSLAPLEELAHVSAVAGVPVSVVGVGEGTLRSELDGLALAGQGTRRLLLRPADAEALVASELSAVSRVVARAVRLRIRLAPGVRLVDVLGSRRLDGVAAERVRVAEQSIDRRLSRNLGIAADRGEDEEGIQIVMPSFYAGDSHVLLLDVVAPGPGAVADVTVRYKDLVFLRNGVARAQLAVGRGATPRGPLEINVLENLLALRLFQSLDEAGVALARGDVEQASDELAGMRTLLAGLALELRGLERDPGLSRDLAMLDEYRALIGANLDPDGRIHLAESLRLAGRLKVLPRPIALAGGR